MSSLSDESQADIIEAFNSTSRHLDDMLNIDNVYFERKNASKGHGCPHLKNLNANC